MVFKGDGLHGFLNLPLPDAVTDGNTEWLLFSEKTMHCSAGSIRRKLFSESYWTTFHFLFLDNLSQMYLDAILKVEVSQIL